MQGWMYNRPQPGIPNGTPRWASVFPVRTLANAGLGGGDSVKKRLTPRQGLSLLISNRRLPFLGVLALVVCLLALSSQPAGAQVAFGSIVGNVTDASGGAVPGASVKITLGSTNDSRSVLTDAGGAYTIATVIPGTYRVEVTRDGFRTFAAADILVNQNNVVRVDAQLQVGSQTERVEVTTTATAELQTERADIHAEI